MALTVDQAKEYILKQIKDFRAPDKKGFETVKNWGEQQKREYQDAREDAARTGTPEDLRRAQRLKEIVKLYEDVVKSRELTTKAQELYENIDANRNKIESLRGLGEGRTPEAKKIQKELTSARAELQKIEKERDAFGTVDKKKQTTPQRIVAERTADRTPYTGYTADGTAVELELDPKKPNVYLLPGTNDPYTGVLYSEDKTKKFDFKGGKYTESPMGKGTGGGAGKGGGKGKGETPPPPLTDEEQRVTALDVAATDFSLPETIFKNVPSLNRILKQYVDENWTEAKLRKAIRDDNWYRKNSAEIKARYVQKFNYDDLVATGQATGSTDYEMQISKIERQLEKRAMEIGSAAANDPVAIRRAAENIYITNRDKDTVFIDDFLASSIKPVAGMIGGKGTTGYSGQALDNYNAILKTARDNGFQISDILPGGANEQQVLQGIATGKIDIDRIKQDARKLAAQGQPQYVRDLLAQGYDLAQVFKPYRQTMANVLEIGDPDQIDLNDPLLRTAITDKGDMNLYDFKKALRQDNRWQYTEQAKADVSNAALNVLRDFGFQG